MPTKNVLFEVNARAFREIIRPALIGKIGQVEPVMAELMAAATDKWLQDVITSTMRDTRLKDDGGFVEQELRTNARVFGGYSLNELRGQFWAYPWLFAQEFGAEIHPTVGQYLALPIYNALRSDGTPKYRNPSSWKRWGSFVYKQKGTGKLFLAYKDADQKLRILYVLVEKVSVPARLGLTAHAEAMLEYLYTAWGQIFVEVASSSGFEVFWDNV